MAENGARREDPVLVRPYVKAVAEAERPADEQPETWPEPAEPTAEEADTLVQPAVVDEPIPAPKSPRLTLHPLARAGIFVGGAALALGVAGYLIFGPAADPGLPQPGLALPAPAGQAPLDPAQPSVGPGVTASASASVSASASASASVSVSPSSSLTPLTPVSPSLSGPPSADPTLAPPASDRTGAITASSGRCLALGSLFGSNGSPVQVSGCVSVPYQSFTLATDGTLRVNDKCAQSTGDGTVRITDCGSGDSAQWRSGGDGTLINSSGGGCLTDPGRAGATTTVSECSGASSQSWTLP